MTADLASLAQRAPSYDHIGATRPADVVWASKPNGYRAYERTVHVGHGEELWNDASEALLSWGVKTRSGFSVEPVPVPERGVRAGDRVWIRAGVGPGPYV